MHDTFETDVLGSRGKARSHDAAVCLEAKIQSSGVGLAADEA